jgi:hypothetical protein
LNWILPETPAGVPAPPATVLLASDFQPEPVHICSVSEVALQRIAPGGDRAQPNPAERPLAIALKKPWLQKPNFFHRPVVPARNGDFIFLSEISFCCATV